ncbi:MAG: DUF6232 family protein [Candidatus Bathyarchaeia archaeon]
MSEVIYYQDEAVTITNARAVLGGKTYAIPHITSVTVGEIRPKRLRIFIGMWFAASLVACLVTGVLAPEMEQARETVGNIGILLAGLVFVAGIVLAVKAKPTYVVRLVTAAGEADAYTSKDKEYVEKVVSALNEAITSRGQ